MYHERIFTAKAADMITAIQNYKINCAGLLNICLCFLLQQNSRMALKNMFQTGCQLSNVLLK